MICECMRLKLNTVMHVLNKDSSKYSIPSNNTLLVNPEYKKKQKKKTESFNRGSGLFTSGH